MLRSVEHGIRFVPTAAGKQAHLTGQGVVASQPTITVLRESRRQGSYQLGPLPTGVGITLGNALRRTLLASVPGAAATTITLDGSNRGTAKFLDDQ